MSEIATLPPAGGTFLPAPTTFDEGWRIAQVLASSDLVPKDYKDKPANCMVAMQWGADIGLPGLQALQNIAVINGRPSIWGDAAKALALNSPACESIEERIEGEGDDMVAICTAKRKGMKPTEQRFSVADAKKAGLWGKQGPWQNYPKRMLQMRARGFALRDAFPDALRGLVLAEEAQDFVQEKFMGEADVVPESKVAQPERKSKKAEQQHEAKPQTPPEPPPEKPTDSNPAASDGQIKFIRNKLKAKDIDEATLLAAKELEALEGISTDMANDCIEWIKQQ